MKKMNSGRMKRISAANPEMKRKDVKALASKRAKSYKANVKRTGLKNSGAKGSLKRSVFRYGDASDVARLKAAKAAGSTKAIKHGSKSLISRKPGERGVGGLRNWSRARAKANAPAAPNINTAVNSIIKRAAGLAGTSGKVKPLKGRGPRML